MYKNFEFKFNGGAGAVLCNGCRTIVAIGHEHEDVPHFCEQCTLRGEEDHFAVRMAILKEIQDSINERESND